MDRFTDKQAVIDQRRTSAAAAYPLLWQRMVSEWQRPEQSDRAWLLYSANYLFRTAGTRWTLDPLTLRQRVPSAPQVDVSELRLLDYIVLTHRHADHLDLELIHQLRDYPARWIVPEFLLESLQEIDLVPEKLIIPHPLVPLRLGRVILTPFNGLHWEVAPDYPDGRRGVPAMGYLAEFNGKRWLLPGDTRTYASRQLPAFGPVDGLFAHLWLGRSSALQDKPPLLESFCKFFLDLSPGRIILSHLDEFGRNANEYWDQEHARGIQAYLQRDNLCLDVQIVQMGDGIEL